MKKNLTYRTLIAIMILLGSQALHSQDLHFSQFFEAPLLRNPSLAGLFEGDIRVQSVYRNQWSAVSFPYQTGSFNMEYKFPVGKGDDFFTGGLQMLYDRAGTVALTTTHVLPTLNFHKSLSASRNTYLSLGFMGGMVSRKLDRSSITTDNQYDGFRYNGSLPDGETFNANYSFLDMTVGSSLSTTLGTEEQHTLFGGIAYHHFNKPINAFYRNINHLPKWVFSGGLKLNLNYMQYLTLHADYSRQGPNQSLVAGGLFTRKIGDEDKPEYKVHLGAYYRYKDAVIPVFKMDWKQFSMSFSYDVNVSALTTASAGRGGLEMALSYMAFLRSEKSSYDKVKCPRF